MQSADSNGNGSGEAVKNPRWLLTGPETIILTEEPVPTECGPYEAIVQPKFTGLCGSDMHIYLHAKNRGKPMARAHVLGHETAAIVAKVGSAVKGLSVGDRVALEPGEACLRCTFCKSGHYAHCRDMKFASAMARDGTLQGFYTLPADLCYKLPKDMSLEEGVLMEPLSVAVQAVQYVAQMRPFSNVVVFGAGPVGLLTMAVAKALGARRVIGVDANASRADFAKTFAASDVHVAVPVEPQEERTHYSERHAAVIREKFGLDEFGPDGVDTLFECSGIETCVQTGLLLLKRRGTLVQVGNNSGYASVPLLAITNRELALKGSFRYGPGCFTTAIDLVHRGLIDLKPLITHKFSWEEAPLAFKTTQGQKGPDGRTAIKVLITGAA